MKWAFIDLENIGNLADIELTTYDKIVIFIGAKQHRLDFGSKKYDSPLNLTVIQIKATQANNLDFHLAYYLGKYDSETANDICFDLISNDNGFTPLVAHIKANGRLCVQVKSTKAVVKAATPINTKTQNQIKPPAKPVIKTTANTTKLVDSLLARPKEKRPQKVVSLRNHIASHMRVQGNEIAIQNHLNQLVNANIVSLTGDGVVYKC